MVNSANRSADSTWSDAALYAAPHPALVADPVGTVRRANEAFGRLVPGAVEGSPLREVLPDWLLLAHDRLTATPAPHAPPPRGEVAGRSFEAHATRLPDGEVVWWLTDDTEVRLAERQLLQERHRAAFLARASSELLSSLNLDRCMEVAGRLAAAHLADAAVVIAPPRGRMLPMVSADATGTCSRQLAGVEPEMVPGLAEALRGFPPVPSRCIDPAAAPEWLVPQGFGPVGAMVVTPLPGHGVPAGALVLLRRAQHVAFSESEEVFARLFAARAGAAMSAARLYAEQAHITETLMRDLLPPRVGQVDGIEFAARYRAAKDGERVGGDFYDIHPAAASGDESLVVLGDVCGKGLDAAVLTGKIRNTLHALLPLAGDHVRILRLLNGALLSSHHTRFATLVVASARRRADRVELRVTCAGHPAPLVVRADGSVAEVETLGNLVGVLPEINAVTAPLTLAPGESVVLFTDGITESRGGPLGDELFGDARLRRALAHCAGMPAEAVAEHVQMLAAEWVGPNKHDDMAVVTITAPRGAPSPAADVPSADGHGV
ncbi:SpoIIE family protein phosphatase [Streptomyces sp. RGM 3693]|uniref:PP2C family protein-serine/threonine phosphatase n=1 Tax=Streptomyces sp. RGM 3693 TaxID=3413284 RepID=UPI003D2DAE55